ncbi:hypothetical protein [Fuerstiella marisgermanici]|nr:hypothetical protein [Fuerstiella marisgermanici]
MTTASHNVESSLQKKAVVVDWYSEHETIQVFGRNQSRFEIQKDRAIEALQVAKQREQFDKQLNLLIGKTFEWLVSGVSGVESIYLTLRDSRLMLVVIAEVAECQDDLEDSVTEFDITVAEDSDLDLIRMNSMVLPNASDEALNSFFDERFLLSLKKQGD